jgi:hypothetical protein
MLPNVVGPGAFPPPIMSSGASARAEQGAQPLVGETSASRARPETPNRVDPPRAMPSAISLRDQERRPPPDPDGPAGPPPTFDATPLQRERERMMARIDLLSAAREAAPAERPAPKAVAAAEGPKPAVATNGPRDVAVPNGPKDVAATDGAKGVNAPDRPKAETVEDAPTPRPDPDAKAAERLETEVAEVRRIAEPETERGLDMVI